MGTLVRSDVTYLDFITGRSVQRAAHYNDEAAGNVVGEVADGDVRASDVAIAQAEYDTIVASIATYNAALPRPSAPSGNTATDDLVIELDALFTARGEALSEAEKADLKTKLLPMMR